MSDEEKPWTYEDLPKTHAERKGIVAHVTWDIYIDGEKQERIVNPVVTCRRGRKNDSI